MKKSHLVHGGWLACIFLATAHGATFNLTSVADTFVTSGNASNSSAGLATGNYGAAGAVQISAPGSTKGEIQTLLKFDFAAAKSSFDLTFGVGNWTIDHVTLQLGTNSGTQNVQPGNGIFNVTNTGVFKFDWLANDSWVEGTGNPMGTPPAGTTDGIAFNGLAALKNPALDKLVGTFTYTPVGATNPTGTPPVLPATYELTLDPALLSDAVAGGPVSLRGYADSGSVSYLFNSHDFGTAANRPVLIVSAVPEPGAAALLSLAGLLWTCRRMRHAAKA